MIAHVAIAVLIQLLVALPSRNWLAGTVAAVAWSVAREVTQAEYRWIERFGGDLRANMPWWGGLDPRVWQKLDPWLDWLVPVLAVVVVAAVLRRSVLRRS